MKTNQCCGQEMLRRKAPDGVNTTWRCERCGVQSSTLLHVTPSPRYINPRDPGIVRFETMPSIGPAMVVVFAAFAVGTVVGIAVAILRDYRWIGPALGAVAGYCVFLAARWLTRRIARETRP